MFCDKCGSRISKDSKFCKNCGSKIIQEETNINDKVLEIKDDIDVSPKNEKPTNGKRRYGLVGIILLSILAIVFLLSSFAGGPASRDYIKTIKQDGIEVTYRYEYHYIDGDTIVQKIYKGTDDDGNIVDTKVTVWFLDVFEGKIDEDYIPTENDEYGSSLYYKQVKVTGTINGYEVDDEDEKLLIDNAIYEKYTDMVDEVQGCKMYVKFMDGENAYTSVNKTCLTTLIILILFDLIGIGAYVYYHVKDKKNKNDDVKKDYTEIKNKVGIGMLIADVALLMLLICLYAGNISTLAVICILYADIIMACIGRQLVKSKKLKKIITLLLIIIVLVSWPYLFTGFLYILLGGF